MHREPRDPETGGDVFIAQQRISGDPASQLVSELARLLDARFRHEDDELVAAIARHHVRTAAILFENMAHALKDHVALEVPVKIVHELEAVEVHQHERERPVGARRALPFRRKRFHQEAMSLDAGKPVGDRLLLGFLERQGVVQGAGE